MIWHSGNLLIIIHQTLVLDYDDVGVETLFSFLNITVSGDAIVFALLTYHAARRDDLKHPDYFSFLLPEGNPTPSDDFLVAQANHLTVGCFGPDTDLFTAAVHYLLENPQTYDPLRDEVRGEFSSWDQMSNETLHPLPYLHAAIEEALRLHTNAAFGLPRIRSGATIDGHYIAQGVSSPM